MKSMTESENKFTCPDCGEFYEAYPPDNYYKQARIKKSSSKKGEYEMKHRCSKCKKMNTLYWYH